MPNEENLNEEDELTTTDDADTAVSEMDDESTEDAGDLSVESLQAELAQVRAQLKSVNDESASRRVELKQLKEKERERELSEMGEAERLQAELNDLKTQLADSEMQSEQLAALNSTIQTQVDALLKELNVPKHIVELLESMTPPQKLDYLNKNRKAFTSKRQPNIDAAGKSGGGGTSRKERKKRMKAKKEASRRYSL